MKKYIFISVATLAIGFMTTGFVYAASSASSVNVGSSANTLVQSQASSSASVDMNAGVDTTSGDSNSQGINVGGNITEDTSAVSNVSVANVNTDADLTTYTESVQQHDTSVSAVSSSDTSVDVSYKVPAKLFGFIPVNVTEKASVAVDNDNKTSVSVSRSWWAIFAHVDASSDSLATHIRAHIPSSVSVSANTKLDAGIKAQLISGIEAGAHEASFASVN